jgi:hypothetical protein
MLRHPFQLLGELPGSVGKHDDVTLELTRAPAAGCSAPTI